MHHLLKAVTIALLAVGLSAALVSRVPAAAVEATPETTADQLHCDQQGHLNSVLLSDDGKLMVSGWDDGKYQVWKVATGEFLHEFHVGLTSASSYAIFSADDRYLVTVDFEAATVWDLQTFAKVQVIPYDFNLGGARRAYLTPDNRFLVSVFDTGASLWEIASGKKVHDYPGFNQASQGFGQLSPDGKYILVRNIDKFALPLWDLWDVQNGQKIHSFESDNGEAIFSNNSRFVALDETSGQGLTLWDIDQRATTHILDLQGDYPPFWWSFSPDNRLLLTNFKDIKIALWDVSQGTLLHEFDNKITPRGGWFYPDSQSFMIMNHSYEFENKASFEIWNAKNFTLVKRGSLTLHEDASHLNVSTDLRYLYAWSNHEIEIRNILTGEVLRRFC
jgi:WD40 repeat protein